MEERPSRHRSTRQQLFPSDNVQDAVQDEDEDEDEEGQDEEAGDYQHWVGTTSTLRKGARRHKGRRLPQVRARSTSVGSHTCLLSRLPFRTVLCFDLRVPKAGGL